MIESYLSIGLGTLSLILLLVKHLLQANNSTLHTLQAIVSMAFSAVGLYTILSLILSIESTEQLDALLLLRIGTNLTVVTLGGFILNDAITSFNLTVSQHLNPTALPYQKIPLFRTFLSLSSISLGVIQVYVS